MSSQHIKELKQAIIAADSAFECSGSIDLNGPLTLFAEVPATNDAPAATVALQFPMVEPNATSLQPLLDACVPASFGRGQDTVLDPAYRQALVLPTRIVAVHAPAFNLTSILEVVGDTLVKFEPNEDKIVAARFDKLNVYGPGGFFKAHADTPRSKEMFASLVLALPCAHTGGELVLGNQTIASEGDPEINGGRKNGDSAKKDDSRVFSWGDSKNIAWVAFSSDRIHEVLPVVRGYRITLTYNLFVDKRRNVNLQTTALNDLISVSLQGTLPFREQPTVKHPIFEALVNILSSPDSFPDGGIIGIHSTNRYIFEIQDTAGSILQNLRGPDYFVYKALNALNLKFSIRYIYLDEGYGSDVVLDQSSTGESVANHQLQDNCAQDIIDSGRGEWLEESGIEVINESDYNVKFVNGTQGNHPSIGFTYGSVMFRIEIPAAKDRIYGPAKVA